LRSIRSSSRARTTNQRGFALLWAIGLAVLFFMLIELMLIDSARELTEAQRFRSRIVAMVLAENAAELAAEKIVDRESYNPPPSTDWQGTITGRMTRNGLTGDFMIRGTGETAGTQPTKAFVDVQGRAEKKTLKVQIFFTKHTP
jgi:Tfp pilus assembly protein PilX